jgi:PAS domain S-box-containing protein
MNIPGSTPANVLSVAGGRATAERTASLLETAAESLTVSPVEGFGAASDYVENESLDCVVATADRSAASVLEFYSRLTAIDDELPVVVVYPGETDALVDDALEMGVTDCLAHRVVENHPALFARRVSTAVAAYRGTTRGADSAYRYRQLFDQVPDPVAILRDSEFVYVNDPSVDLLEAPRDRILGTNIMEIIPEDDRQVVEERFASLLEGSKDQVPRADRELVVFDGQRKHVQVTSGAISYEGEQAILITARDVTERRERQQQLTWYETMVETVGDIVYTLDEDYYFTTVTGAAADLTGYTCEELEGKNLSLLLPEAEIERGREYRKKVISGEIETGSIEVELHRKDGTVRPVEFRYRRLPFDDDFRGTAGVVRDISERVEQERELRRQNERLEEFADIVSHDLRNPLNVAKGRVELARDECDSDHLDEVADAHARMETLIDETLQLAKQGRTVSTTEPIRLATIADDCWEMVATKESSLERPETGTIHGDPDRVRQLLENLFRNSVEHGGDSVTVRVGLVGADGFFVEDDGPGIPEDERDTVFDSGYTTGETGTGFGLAIVEEIADAHEWAIRATERDAGGARFEITGVDVEP